MQHTANANHTKLYTLSSVFNEKAPPDYTKTSSLYPQSSKADDSFRYRPSVAATSASRGSINIPVNVQQRQTAVTSVSGSVGSSSSSSMGARLLNIGPRPVAGEAAAMTLSLYDGVSSSGELLSNYLNPSANQHSASASFNNRYDSAEAELEQMCFRCGRSLPAGLALHLPALAAYFHPYCFLCYHCHSPLTQATSFYHAAGRLLCEACVQDALELCALCKQPVTERILRALGQPYHPACFRCTQCRRQLDGQGFTVDLHGRVLCLEDFHRRYAPRCAACAQPITPARGHSETRRVLVDNQSFHINCFHGSSIS